MKILVISDAWLPQVNGVVRTYQNLSTALHDMGHVMDILGPRDCRFHMPLPSYPDIDLALFPARRVAQAIISGNYDRIHIATEGPMGWAARRICLKHGISFTTCYHTQFPAYIAARLPRCMSSPVQKIAMSVLRRFHRHARKILVATPTLRDFLIRHGFKNSFARLTRGIDPAIFHPGPKTLFQDLPGPIALHVGRIAPEKNIDAFLNANWAGTKIVVGDGPLLPQFRRDYPHIHFLGWKTGSDLADCYRSADIFVFPSRTDTFGLVNIEALACGLPVAAYPVAGPGDIIADPSQGILHTDLELAMKLALASPGTRLERGQTTQKTYNWCQVAIDFLAAQENYG